MVVGTLDEVREQKGGASAAHVVLETIRAGGPEGLSRLRGVFATVVTDGRRVWAARDHVGTETLYYHEVPGRVLLVSEPKQLEAIPGIRLEPDVEVVEAIFYGEESELRRSVYRGVFRLGMASYLEWSETGSRVGRYWRPEALLETARLTPGEITERFDELMCRAVRRTVRDRTAVLLSGGIDSPAVAAYAGTLHPHFVGAISAVYALHPTVDERALIEMLAGKYGLELQTFTPGPLKLDRLAEWVRAFDGPWSAWHPGWSEQSYRFAAERSYSVVLTGFFAELLTDLTRGLVPHLVATGRVRPALAYLAEAGQVEIVDLAPLPGGPIGVGWPRTVMFGLLLGVLLGGGSAFLADQLNRSVHRREDVAHRGLPVLGIVPHANGNSTDGAAPVVEAMRGIRFNVMHAHGVAGPALFTITSPGSREGKSFVASNLALAFADAGHRTLLIDGDLRRGSLYRILNTRRKPGLTDVLHSEIRAEQAIQATRYPPLFFVGCGTRTPDAPELLGSEAMAKFVAGVRQGFSAIIVDSPPLGAGVDADALGAMTGNLVLVLRLGTTDREVAEAKLELLDRLPVRLLRTVLNDVPENSAYAPYSYYMEGYAYEAERGREPRTLTARPSRS